MKCCQDKIIFIYFKPINCSLSRRAIMKRKKIMKKLISWRKLTGYKKKEINQNEQQFLFSLIDHCNMFELEGEFPRLLTKLNKKNRRRKNKDKKTN